MSGQEIASSELRVASLIDYAKIVCEIIRRRGPHITAVQSFVCVCKRVVSIGLNIVIVGVTNEFVDDGSGGSSG
jgi:hypothetical protein